MEKNNVENKSKIKVIPLIILIVGILIGGSLIATGLMKQKNINSQYSDENKQNVTNQIETEKQNLLNKKSEIETKGIKYNEFSEYTDGEEYDLYIITKVLNPSFDYCKFDEYKNNDLTSKYCSLKNSLDDNNDFNKRFESSRNIPYYMFGGFVIVASCMISGFVFSILKGRELAKDINFSDVGKELAKGLKVMKDELEKETSELTTVKCTNCGATNEGYTGTNIRCSYCKTLIKVKYKYNHK